MKWVVCKQILDLRSATPSWYYLAKSFTWVGDREKAREFFPLSVAEEVAKDLGAEVKPA
jgi:lipoprotein NlpI